jgi:hypothetical protein
MRAMSNAPLPPVASPETASPPERAAEALVGWLDAGERVAVLLAPRGAARHEALARLEQLVADRFVADRWSAAGGSTPAPSTLEELRGRRALAIVENGEELGAEGARTLRASLEDPAGARCAVVALAADEAGAVLAGLGHGLEVVVLRDARRPAKAAPFRAARAAAAGLLAFASVALAALVVLPRLGDERIELAPAGAPASPTAVATAPVTEPGTERTPATEPAPAAEPAAAATPARELPAAAAPPKPAAELPAVAAAPPAAQSEAALEPERAPAAPPSARAPAPRRAESPARRAAPTPSRVTPPPDAPQRAAAPAPAPPADGWLVVNSIPRAEIHLDGAVIGQTPIVRHRVSAGSHRVIARFGDGSADERTIRVAGGELYLMFDGR